jgi:hypothetical protein
VVRTFVSATLDGKRWTVDSTRGVVTPVLTPDGTLVIVAATGLEADTARVLGFEVHQFRGVGTYRLASTTGPSANPGVGMAYYEVYAHVSIDLVSDFQTSAVHTGEVRVTTVDTANHVIAGTFAFTAVEFEGTGIAHVTNGAFRISYP